jgi:hypothetical protein
MHSFQHPHRSWLDEEGTTSAVQQQTIRCADIRTTMNIEGDLVTDERSTARSKTAKITFQEIAAQTERKGS